MTRSGASARSATLLCVKVLAPEGRGWSGEAIALTAGTDNGGNGFILDRLSSTKYPLFLVLMELSALLDEAHQLLTAVWRPREEHDLADVHTNEVFDAFSMERRVTFKWHDLMWEFLQALVVRAEGFFKELQRRKKTAHRGGEANPRSRRPGHRRDTGSAPTAPGSHSAGPPTVAPNYGLSASGHARRRRRPMRKRDLW